MQEEEEEEERQDLLLEKKPIFEKTDIFDHGRSRHTHDEGGLKLSQGKRAPGLAGGMFILNLI